MSTTIDNRVVEMQFNNKNFESNVETTLSTLDKLKQKLNLTGAAKGLDSVNNAAKNCDMSALGSGVEAVRLKFSALEVMGVTALANITNSAVNAGKRIVSALTIDPIKTGFDEYETKINSIQTIMSNTASKGTTMDDVTRVIGELNTYADKTIYNFAEMTRNIGTFTAAGIGLEESASAIQGIANLAAASGSTSQQASTAMYQLSQAMASGTVKLMDWNSVVNAGMGGQKFQDALKATAKEHGIAIDDIIEKQGSFRESLSEGWLSADILSKTLQKFTVEGAEEYADAMLKSGKYTQEQADALIKEANAMNDAATKVKTFTQLWDTLKESAQSGWSQTWEIIIGDFEEAKEFLTEVSDTIGGIIGASADARNAMLENWKVLGGRDDLLQSLRNAFEGISSIIKPISEAFREIFPPITSEQLAGFTEGLKNLTEKLIIGDETADKIKRTFKGLFAVIDIVRQIFVAAFKAITPLIGGVGDLGGGILGVTASFGDWLVALNEAIKNSNVLNKVFGGIGTVLSKVIDVVKNIAKWFKTNLIEPIFGVRDAASEMGEGVTSAFDSIGSALESCSLFKIMQSIWTGISNIATGVAKALGSVTGGLFEKIANGDFQGVLDFLNGLITGGIGIGIAKLVHNLANSAKGFAELKDGVIDIVDGLGGCLEGFQSKLKAGALMKIATAVAILAAAILVLSTIDGDKLANALGAITVLFTELMVSMSLFSKITGDFKGVTKACSAMISISIAILLLASALKTIGSLDFNGMVTGLVGVAGLMGIVIATIKLLDGNKAVKGAAQMIIFAAAIKILASVVEDLAYLGWEDLGKGLVGILGMAAVLVATAKILSMGNNKDVIKGATQMVIFAAAIKIMASACEDLSMMSWEAIGKGLTAIAGLIAEVVIFTKLTSGTKKVLSTSVAMVVMAGAMKIFASVMADMAALSWGEIARGLVAMAGALAAVVIAMNLMPKNMIGKAVGMVVVASALLIISNVLSKLGGMSWESIAKGMVALGGAMIILALGLHAMQSTIAGSASLLVAAAALLVLTPVLTTLGNMSWASIAKGLVTIAGAFVIIGVAGYALSGVSPVILAVAGAIALVGIAVLAAGVGLVAFGAGLSALAVGFTALVGSLGAVCTGIVSLVSSLIKGILKGIADGIVAFCEVIIQGIPAIGEALTVVVLELCEVLIKCLPVIVETVLKLVVSVLESLVEYTPKLVDLLFQFLVGVLDGLARNIPTLIVKVVEVLMSIFDGVIEALSSIDPDVLIKGLVGVGLMAALMYALAGVAMLVPAAMVGVIGLGVVMAELAIVLAAIGALAQIPGLEWLISEGGNLMQAIGTAIGKFIGGIAGGVAQGFTSSLPQIGTDLSTFMTNILPFIAGASAIDSSTLDGVKSLIGVILALTGANIIESLTSWLTGGSSLTKFGEELASFGPNIRSYADAVSGIDTTAVEASANAAKALAQMTSYIPKEGGIAAWFAGENSISKFSGELVTLGYGLKSFSDSIVGVNPEAIVAAAQAAKAVADMTSTIPNEGGMVAWFTGENSVSKFAGQLVSLGTGLKGFSDAIVGINPENIIAAANAAQALCDMTSSIPNEGGVVAWFTGENSISKFSNDLISLGFGLKGFSDAIVGVNPENLIAAAGAARALADMTTAIPNEGGIVAWFTGENSISKFGSDLIALGLGLKGFSDAIVGVNPEALTAAAGAAKSLAEMSSYIPNEGGVVSWFTGENSLSKFGSDLIALGIGLKGFSEATTGINPEALTASANAAKSLAEMTTYIPNEGGVVAWFTGESSIANFASKLPALGKGLKGFSASIEGINPENVSAAANAAKSLAEMTAVIPKEGGIKAWFSGETSIANFADKLPALGEGLVGFSDSVAGINPENVTAAANAAKSLAQMLETMPKNVSKISDFGTNVVSFGKKLKQYFTNMSTIGEGAIASSNNALAAIKDISTIDAGNIKSVASALKELTNAVKNMAKNVKTDLTDAGKEAIEAFVNGIKDKTPSAEKACKSMVDGCADAIASKTTAFSNAARDLVKGFASGISANSYRAEAKARAMAKAAAQAAEDELDINSPSRVLMETGTSVPEGFALGIDKYSRLVTDSSVAMGNEAISGVKDSISRIADIVNGDIDSQPTIRPVLDLSDVRSGASAIGDIFGSGASVGVLANVGTISTMMNRRSQNGTNNDVVSAIDDLHKDLGKVGNTTYQLGDITYSEGSEVAEAVEALVKAIKIERRT